jgi:heme exporter protein B
LPLTLAAIPLGYLLNLPAPAYLWLLASLAIGTPALSFIGAFGAAVTVGIKRGGLLLSLLVLPLYIPTLIFGAITVTKSADGLDPLPSLILLAGLSLFSIVLMPFASALALKANLSG